LKILVLGGTADSLLNFRGKLLEEFIRKGHCVHAAAGDSSRDAEKELTNLGVSVHNFDFNRTSMNLVGEILSIKSLIQLLKSVRPDVLISYTLKVNLYTLIALRFVKVCQVACMFTGLGSIFINNSTRGERFLSFVVRSLLKVLLRKNIKVIFQNPDDYQFFCNCGVIKGNSEVAVIRGSGVDELDFPQTKVPRRGIVFLMISRLLADKGIIEFVEASKKTKAIFPNAKFVLVGGEDTNPSSITFENLLKFDNGAVEYVGHVKDVIPYLNKCSVFVLPSYREGLPRSTLEAMSVGRPIITSDAPGCRETVIEGLNGFLVPVADSDAIFRKMTWFIKNREKLHGMGDASRNLVIENFRVKIVNDKLCEFLEL